MARLQPCMLVWVLWALCAMCLWVERAHGVTLPAGFVATPISPELEEPVAIAFVGDGRMFVSERPGRLKVVQNGKVISTFIDLVGEINMTSEDRGLLGIALDPNFLTNRYVYLIYTVDPMPGEPNEPPNMGTYSRLVRYQGTLASGGNIADLASRTVLIGATAATGIPVCSHYHVGGALRFAADGSLLVAHGESAMVGDLDAGGMTPQCFTGGLYPGEDMGAFRSQNLDSMGGKILRLDPATGNGLPGNPYFNPGSPASNRSRVWVSGLRNPFRFSVRPGTGGLTHPGTLYIGDVGWNTWEEFSVSTTGGENFGWPCREGFHVTANYPGVDMANWDCASIETPSNPGPLTAPMLDYHHFSGMLSSPAGYSGVCMIAGVFHSGNTYPSPFRGGFFYADNTLGWIRVARVNAANQVLGIHQFATGANGPTDFVIDPQTGDVCYASLFEGRVYRIQSNIGPGDVNRNGVVDVDDLIAVILGWGPCANPVTCPADLNVSGAVEVDDLIEVILNWG